MSFVDGFYTFSLHLALTEQNVYASIRIKTPKHPDEEPEHLAARVIALAHAFEPGIEFSEGLYRPEQPTIQVPDGIGGLSKWVDVGCPDPKKVRHALGGYGDTALSVYFYMPDNLERFCHSMRGTKKNWLAPVRFYSINPELPEALSNILGFRNEWRCTFVDSSIFIESGDEQFSGTIEPQDIWQQYQLSIGNI